MDQQNTHPSPLVAKPETGRVSEAASSSAGIMQDSGQQTSREDAEQKAREAVQASFNVATEAGGAAEQKDIPNTDSSIRMDKSPGSYRIANEAEHDLKMLSNVKEWLEDNHDDFGGSDRDTKDDKGIDGSIRCSEGKAVDKNNLACYICCYVICDNCISDESKPICCKCGKIDRRKWTEDESKQRRIQDVRKRIRQANIRALAARSSSKAVGDVASGDAEPNESSMSSDTTRKPPSPPPAPAHDTPVRIRRWQRKQPGTALTNEDCEASKGAVIEKDREHTINFNDSMQAMRKTSKSRGEYKRLIQLAAKYCNFPRAPRAGDILQTKSEGSLSPKTCVYTQPSPNGVYVETLPSDYVLPPIISVRIVEIGKHKTIGIAIEVDSGFVLEGAGWLKEQCKALWINISKGHVMLCQPYQWSQTTDRPSSEDYEDPMRPSESSDSAPSENEQTVIDHDWYTLPARGLRAYKEYSNCAAAPLRHWNLHNAWAGAVEWFDFVKAYRRNAERKGLDLDDVKYPHTKIIEYMVLGADKPRWRIDQKRRYRISKLYQSNCRTHR